MATESASTVVQINDSDDLLYATRRMLQNMGCAFPGRGAA
jgi:hypothetical protein